MPAFSSSDDSSYSSGISERELKSKEDSIKQRLYPANAAYPKKTDKVVRMNSTTNNLDNFIMPPRYGDQTTFSSRLYGQLVRSYVDWPNRQRVSYYFNSKECSWRVIRYDLPNDYTEPITSPTHNAGGGATRWPDPITTGAQRRRGTR